MNDLTPSFERETGQVMLEGLPAGAAGEAPLVPVPGLDLAFDRADGRLCRAVVDAAGTDGSIAVGEQVAAILTRLFGAEAMSVVSEPARDRVLSPEPGLTATLSRLARLDATRATSPIHPARPRGRPRPPNSPNASACTLGPAPKQPSREPGHLDPASPPCRPRPRWTWPPRSRASKRTGYA
jgi:hypothetical protein